MGKAILRDYINATIGFEELSRVTKRPAKSLMRMFGPAGNRDRRTAISDSEAAQHDGCGSGWEYAPPLHAAA
jgi:hypothetical protein